jgi:ComF family protein
MYAPFSYSNKTIRTLIHRLKYRRVQPYAAIAAAFLENAVKYYMLAIPHNTVIVAVPLHASRFLERGFNQSEHIGQELSQRLSIPFADRDVLIRHKRTKPQAQIKNPKERKENIKDAFCVRNATDIFRKNVLLIDDVATTGETLNEAAKALRRGGAKSVWAFTLAK